MDRRPLLGAQQGTRHIAALAAALALSAGCSAADATATDPVASYKEALAPLKQRSDVLEDEFAGAQAKGYDGPGALHDVLVEIIPEYAELLEETRAIEVDDDLGDAQSALVASLEAQQRGLELALSGLEDDDAAKMRKAGNLLQKAQRLVDEHRRLLAKASRASKARKSES